MTVSHDQLAKDAGAAAIAAGDLAAFAREVLDYLAVPAPPPPAVAKPIGFATGYPDGDAFDRHWSIDTYVGKVRATGANFLRFDIPNLANDGDYSGTIARVRACKANGIAVMLTPRFDLNATAYGTYTAGAIKALEAAGVHLDSGDWIEFGNEINLVGPRIMPEAYGAWHRTVYSAVKATGTPAKIATGSVASFGQYGSTGTGIDMVLYTERMLAADPSLGATFDAIAPHPYWFANDATVAALEDQASVWSGLGDALSHAHNLLGALDAHPASAGKPLFFNEVGVDTDELPWSGGVSEAVQAQYYGDLVRLVAVTPRICGLGLYSFLDKAEVIASGTSREGSFGIYHPDFTPKPAVAAVQAAIAATRAAAVAP